MKNLDEIFAAERLIKNLMWLERRNPLLPPKDLLTEGCRYSERIKGLMEQAGEAFRNEVLPMKTLEMMLRNLIQCEMEAVTAAKAAPKFESNARNGNKIARAYTRLSGSNNSDLSLPMARGRAEKHGGGSTPIYTTA